MTGKIVTIKLSLKDALLIHTNADGWLDAGSCEGGLEPEEILALESLIIQIEAQTIKDKVKK